MSKKLELTEDQQREVLRVHGWVALEGAPLGEGGGARVFKVLKGSVLTELGESLRTPYNDRDIAERNANRLALLLAGVVDGTETVIAAGKVAKTPDYRVKREIEILRDVQHPNLIRMLDYDRSDNPTWYAMPVMRGGVLKGKTGLAGELPVVVRGMLQVTRALEALHTHSDKIVHRDIKPGNVFVSENGDWILGDPGVAYRDDDGDETRTRPVSKDWAPTWYGEELARTPKADLYMLGKTVFSVLVGGDKPLDPGHVRKPKFDLPVLFREKPGVREFYDLLCSLVVSEPDDMPFKDARELIPSLEALVPVVENSPLWQLQERVERVSDTPQVVFTFANSNTTAVSGNHEGLKRVPIWIPEDCNRLVFWPRGHNNHTCGVHLHDQSGKVLLAKLDAMEDDTPTALTVPTEAIGDLCA